MTSVSLSLRTSRSLGFDPALSRHQWSTCLSWWWSVLNLFPCVSTAFQCPPCPTQRLPLWFSTLLQTPYLPKILGKCELADTFAVVEPEPILSFAESVLSRYVKIPVIVSLLVMEEHVRCIFLWIMQMHGRTNQVVQRVLCGSHSRSFCPHCNDFFIPFSGGRNDLLGRDAYLFLLKALCGTRKVSERQQQHQTRGLRRKWGASSVMSRILQDRLRRNVRVLRKRVHG